MAAMPAPKVGLDTLQKAMFKQLVTLKTDLGKSEALKRAKMQLLSSEVFQQGNLVDQSALIGDAVAHQLPPSSVTQFYQLIRGVSAGDVRRAANHYLVQDNLVEMRLTKKRG